MSPGCPLGAHTGVVSPEQAVCSTGDVCAGEWSLLLLDGTGSTSWPFGCPSAQKVCGELGQQNTSIPELWVAHVM